MILETQEQQIRYLENYYENRCSKLSNEGKKEDAQALYHEIVVDDQDPGNYLFFQFVSEV
jgi:hypothetical protein